MSDASTEFREPSIQEVRLLRAAAGRWPASPPDWVQQVIVRSMKDGGMGSLELLLPESPGRDRIFGGRVAELQFRDEDGVDVIVSLNVDQDQRPFELDIWKTDFSPLKGIPEGLDQ